jgi:hypothetical protein
MTSLMVACAGVQPPREREIARVRHALPARLEQREVRALFDGEEVRLSARMFALCKSSVTTTVELYDAKTGESRGQRMNTEVDEHAERCNEQPAAHARIALRVQGADYYLGEADGRGQLTLGIASLFQHGAPIPDKPGEPLMLSIDEKDAGSLPLAPLLARRTSRDELLRDLQALQTQPVLSDEDLSRGIRLADALRSRGLDGPELRQLERGLFTRRAPSDEGRLAHEPELAEARQAAAQPSARHHAQLPAAVTTTLQTGAPTQQSSSWVMILVGEVLGQEFRRTIRENRTFVCSGATNVASLLLDKVASVDPRIRVAWPLLKAMLGEGTAAYCNDACVQALADEQTASLHG